MDFNDEENIEWLMESSKTVEEAEENVDFNVKEQESIELYRFLHVLRKSFVNEPILVESKAKGTVNSEEDILKLIKSLKAMGYFFSVRTSGYSFSTSVRKVDRSNRLMVINMKFPPSSHPYRVINHTYYYCSYRNRESEEMGPEHFVAPSSSIPKCKAIMEIRQIEIFKTISVPTNKRKRVEVLKKFRRKIMRNPQIVGEIKFEVVISLPKTHNHGYDLTGKRLNEEVKAALYYVLRTGTTSIEGIQEKLYQIVDREFEDDIIKPSRNNTAFYPTQRTIYYHLRRDGIQLKRIHKNKLKRLVEMKEKTRDLLNSLTEKVESCSDLELIIKLYNKVKSITDCFEGVDMMTQNAFERETYGCDNNTF